MNLFELIIISLGLSADSLAISISGHLILKKINFLKAVNISLFFAVFQAAFLILGYLLGMALKNMFNQISLLVAFSVISIIGIKMIIESAKLNSESRTFIVDKLSKLIGLSVAVSIDAFIVGITFPLIKVLIFKASLIIAVVTFLVSLIGIYVGNKYVCKYCDRKTKLVGGIILIFFGIKILLKYLSVI